MCILFKASMLAVRLSWLLTSICILRCAAQITGDIEVRVMDSSRAVVSKALVALHSRETGVSRELRCDANGEVRFRQLQAGLYDLRANAPGFESSTSEALVASGA